jgi:hypothetical protein
MNSIGFSTGSVTSWVGSTSAIAQIPKAWGFHVLQNIGQYTGNNICASRETVSGVKTDL